MTSPEIYENALDALNKGSTLRAFHQLGIALDKSRYTSERESMYKAVAVLFVRDVELWLDEVKRVKRTFQEELVVMSILAAIPLMTDAFYTLYTQQEAQQLKLFPPPWKVAADDLEQLEREFVVDELTYIMANHPEYSVTFLQSTHFEPFIPDTLDFQTLDTEHYLKSLIYLLYERRKSRLDSGEEFLEEIPRSGGAVGGEKEEAFDEESDEDDDLPPARFSGGSPPEPIPQRARETGEREQWQQSEPPPSPITHTGEAKPVIDDSSSDSESQPEADKKRAESPAPPPPPISTPSPAQPITPIPNPSASYQPGSSSGSPSAAVPKPAKPITTPKDDNLDVPAFLRRRDTAASTPPAAPEPVQFSSFYSKDVKPKTWYPVKAYVFRESAQDQIEADAHKQFGGVLTNVRNVLRAARTVIQQGAEVTATPSIPGFQFDPVRVTVAFTEQWHKFDFKMRAMTADPDDSHKGAITFTVEGLIVAEVPLSVYVSDTAPDPVEAKLDGGAQVAHKPYAAVFCSYSRKDEPIVKRVEKAIKTLGFDYWRDLTTLRPGEDWDDRLLALIEQADIFQLFWSSNSATSNAVRKEWAHALKVGTNRANFIRPVFWEQPMPAPPQELGHINFVYDPSLIE